MSKLSPQLEREVMARATAGESADALSAWLLGTHQVKISGRALRLRLARTRTERADVAKAVVRETLGKSIGTDLDRLERLARKAEKLAKKNEHVPDLWVKLADTVRKISETKLHFSGADQPDGQPDAVAGPVIFIPPESDG